MVSENWQVMLRSEEKPADAPKIDTFLNGKDLESKMKYTANNFVSL